MDFLFDAGRNARLGLRAKEGRDSEDDFRCGCHLEMKRIQPTVVAIFIGFLRVPGC